MTFQTRNKIPISLLYIFPLSVKPHILRDQNRNKDPIFECLRVHHLVILQINTSNATWNSIGAIIVSQNNFIKINLLHQPKTIIHLGNFFQFENCIALHIKNPLMILYSDYDLATFSLFSIVTGYPPEVILNNNCVTSWVLNEDIFERWLFPWTENGYCPMRNLFA